MSIIKRFASMFSFENTLPESWQEIEAEGDVKNILQSSNEKPQIIFKHSPSCSISAMAKYEMESIDDSVFDTADVNYVDVIRNRPLSQLIAHQLDVRHESPQLIYIKDGEVKWHGSHSHVNGRVVNELIQSF